MTRRYTRSVIREAFADSPLSVSNPALTKDYHAGRFTAKIYRYGQKALYGATVHDVQSWLAVTNRGTATDLILQKLLDLSAEKIIAQGGLSANQQKYLDKETGHDLAT